MKSAALRPALLAALLLGGSAPAQDEDERRQKPTANIPICPDSDALVQRAPVLAAQARWAEALGIYEAALEKYPGSVVEQDQVRATGLLPFVRAQIDAWPEEGKAFVRRRSDPLADHEFAAAKRAGDVVGLEAVAERHPWSSRVDEALLLAGTIRLDSGDEAGAAETFERLLARPPGPAREAGAGRLALAYARLGRREALAALAERAKTEFPGAVVRRGDGERPLAEVLEDLARGAARPAGDAVLRIPSWPMPGGGPSGSALAEPGVELARLAWTDAVPLPRLDADDGDFGLRRLSGMHPTADFRPLFPAVADGIVYVHNGLALTAYSLFARAPEKLWQYRAPPPPGEVMFDNRVIYAPVASEGRVYANLITAAGGAEDQLGYVRVKFPFPKRALHAFDAHTGRLLWKVGGRLRADGLEQGASFSTGPTPDGARLYAGAVTQKFSTDPFQHHVLCIEAATGRILWSTFVGSGGTEINLFGNPVRESLGSPVAVTDDAVYYATNHGVFAALEKKTGRLRWIHRYRQAPVRPTRSVSFNRNPLEWVSSPPVAAEGVVVAAPTDSTTVAAYDARDGRLVWERSRGGGSGLRTLYGARGRTLVLGGERLEFVDLRTGKALTDPVGPELGGAGRGVLAEDGVYVPCRDRLCKVSWDGTWDAAAVRRWPGTRAEGGNLVVVDGAIVLAGQDSIQVFFDRRDQERAVREALERHPDDPALLYRAGLRFLQSGQTEEALRLLARAMERTADGRRPDEERLHAAAKRRLFTAGLAAGRSAREEGRLDEALKRFEDARRTAPDAGASIEVSLELGRTRLAARDDRGAVGEYQGLIVRSGGEIVEGVPVFDLARRAIAAVLSATGRGPYEPHEEAAGRLLAEARRGGAPARLEEVFRLFPNSRAAEEALAEAAALQRRLGRADEEVSALRQLLREFPDSAAVPAATADLVRALEKKGHLASAAALLRRLQRQHPAATVPGDDGAPVPAKDFAAARLKLPAYHRAPGAAPLPDLKPPLKPEFSSTDREFPEGVPLLPGGTPPAGVAGLLLMHYASPGAAALKALGPDGREAWQLRLASPLRFSVYVEEGLLLADEAAVRRVDARTGRVDWTYEACSRMRGFGLAGPHLFFFNGAPGAEVDQRLVALDALRGTEAWTQPFDGVPSSPALAAGEHVAFTTVAPNRVRCYDAETGRSLAENAPFALGLTAQAVHAGEDVLVLHSEGRFLEVFDLPSGTLRWRASVAGVSSRGLEVDGDSLVYLGVQRAAAGVEERLFLQAWSLRTGKVLRRREAADLGDPRFLLADGDRLFLVSVEADGSVAARGVSPADFKVLWKAPVGPAGVMLGPPFRSRGHLGVGMFEQGPDQRFGVSATLLDREGKSVQNIRGETRFERPPGVWVAGDRLIFGADARVDVYR